MDSQNIKSRAVLGLPLTERERARYLLFIATDEEARAYLERERTAEATAKCKQ